MCSADLSVWLEDWDRSAAPGRLVEGITGLGLDDVERAGDRWVQVDCPRRLVRHTHAVVGFARQAVSRARDGRVAIGLPCTPRGLAGAEELLWRGISVGLGPVSTAATWRAVAQRCIRALERRRAVGLPVDEVACVAWVPVGLIDDHSDPFLSRSSSLRGAGGIAVAQLLYLLAFQMFAEQRWIELRAHGAQPPRLGWNRLTAERRASYISRLTLPGSVIALGHPWASEIEGHELDVTEADETEARWTSRELIRGGVPLDRILGRLEATAA
jgi:hypothetical protein